MEQAKEIVVYKVDSDSSPLGFMFDGETIWLTQEQIASVFGVDRTTVSRHIKNIYDEGELDSATTSAEIARVVDNKRTYQVTHYNLDVVISVGYRGNSIIEEIASKIYAQKRHSLPKLECEFRMAGRRTPIAIVPIPFYALQHVAAPW